MIYFGKLKFVLLCLLPTIPAFAQEDPEEFITDRPDETEAPRLVPKGYFQVETGFLYENSGEGSRELNQFTYNTTLIRYGLLENLELRLGADLMRIKPEAYNEGIENRETGLAPILLGAKIGIAEENGLLPEIGFMGHLYLPFAASSQYRPETTGVDFRFAFSHTLSENSGLSYNLGAEWRDDSPEAFYIYSISYAYDFTSSLGLFTELYGEFPENNSASHSWDAGLTYKLQHDIQLDALVGSGFNNDQNLIMGGGVSFRIPK